MKGMPPDKGGARLRISDYLFLETQDFEQTFYILKQSNPHYHNNVNYDEWLANIQLTTQANLSKCYFLLVDDTVVGTGAIVATSDKYGVVGAVAVLPPYRGNGYGFEISQFITKQILQLNKQPVLMTSGDNIVNLYSKVGYKTTHKWGYIKIL